MRKIREILRLRFVAGFSPRQISSSIGAALSTVQECLRRARSAELGWPLPEALDDAELEARLYPTKSVSTAQSALGLDFPLIHRELSRPGVTRYLLWQEYKTRHPEGLQYTAFVQYRRWRTQSDPVMRFVHQAGEKLFVDYAGHTVKVIDRHSGELRTAQIFVAILGCSNYTFAEATWTQGLAD